MDRRTLLRLLIPGVLVGLLGLAREAVAQAVQPVRLAPTDADLAAATRDHFEILLIDEKVGWLMQQMGPDVLDGEDVLAWRQERLMSAVQEGWNWERMETSEWFFSREPPYDLLLARREARTYGYLESVVVTPSETGTIAVVEKAGHIRTLVLPRPDITYADRLTPHLWIREPGRKVGDTLAYRSFDMGQLREVTTHCELTGTHEDPDGATVYEVSVQADDDEEGAGNLELPYHTDASGRLVGGHHEGLLLAAAPEDQARTMGERPANVWRKALWAIDKKIGNPKQITQLVLVTEDDLRGQVADGPLQSVRHDPETGRTTVSLGVAFGALERVSDAAREAALAETAIHPIHDERVQRLAKQAVAGVAHGGPREQLAALLFFVDTFITDDLEANPPTLLDILEVRRGDCTEHALMFVTLARALGLPAREVDGYVHGGDRPPKFGLHRWVEVDLDGHWHSMDPSWSEVELNATHIRLGVSDGVTDWLPLSVGVKFKVEEIRYRKPARQRR